MVEWTPNPLQYAKVRNGLGVAGWMVFFAFVFGYRYVFPLERAEDPPIPCAGYADLGKPSHSPYNDMGGGIRNIDRIPPYHATKGIFEREVATLVAAMSKYPGTIHFQIINGTLYSHATAPDGMGLSDLLRYFLAAVQRYSAYEIPDAEFVVSMLDIVSDPEVYGIMPLLTHSLPGGASASKFIGIPSPWMYAEYAHRACAGKYAFANKSTVLAPPSTFWGDRRSALVWRGSPSNPNRTKFVRLGRRWGCRLDVQFSSYPDWMDAEKRHRAMAEFGLHPEKHFLSENDQANNFKFVADLDGCGWSGRFAAFLARVLCVMKGFVNAEFFFDALVPWKHYVPMAPDGGDALATVEWCMTHSSHARAIGRDARAFFEENLSTESTMGYLAATLYEYATLMQFTPSRNATLVRTEDIVN